MKNGFGFLFVWIICKGAGCLSGSFIYANRDLRMGIIICQLLFHYRKKTPLKQKTAKNLRRGRMKTENVVLV